MTIIDKYRGKYRVFMPLDEFGKPTRNEFDTYIKGKYKTEVYRYSADTLAIQFVSNSTVKNVLPKLNELGINLTLFVQGDYESVYFFPEKDLDKMNEIFNFRKKGAKLSPKSVITARSELKKLNKINKNK